VVSKRLRLPPSELARLKKTYFERPLEDYPVPRALETGSLEAYDKLWRRRENPVAPDQSFLRQLIHSHLCIARRADLHPTSRTRALDLVGLLAARAEQPDVQLWVSADEVGDGWLDLEESETIDLVGTKQLTEPLQKQLAKAEKKWKVSGFEYSV